MTETILNSFDIWTDARAEKHRGRVHSIANISLEGIAHLRELILELAVRGKLVPQNPDDEPASKLLQKIAAEKKKLIEEGKIRKHKLLPKITNDEKPFEIPETWEYVRLNDIGDWGAGATPARNNSMYYDGDIPWFKSGELSADFIDTSEEKVTELALKETSLRYNNIGDVLIAMYGATIGKVSILNVRATTNQAVCACTPCKGFDNVFLLTLLKAYKERFTSRGAGGAQPNISREKIIETVIPLPPLEEQKRIVAKVDELMALCDRLEDVQTRNLQTHDDLVKALLGSLTAAKDAAGVQAAWQQMLPHFDVLFTTEDSIEQLKQTILQLAVMGRLVAQNPDDEPASKLLQKIAAEKKKLIEEGKIKKEKPLPAITEKEKPFALPNGWEWVRVADISYVGNGSTPEKKYFTDNIKDIPYLKVYNIRNQKIDFNYKPQFITKDCHINKLNRSICYTGDVLMNIVGPPLGKIAIVPMEIKECNINQAIVLIRPHVFNLNNWIYTYLCELSAIKKIETRGSAGQDNISVTQSRNLLLPLPPLEEQKRIVAKVDELFAICDALKERITAAEALKNHLSATIIQQAAP